MDFVRPRILVSRCLGFEKCRWDGNWVESSFVKKLGEFVDFVTVCPECEIGLSTPRKPLRLVGKGDDVRMIQHETLKDFSEEMTGFSKKFVDGLGKVHGAILKSRSPSCGSRDAKVYPEIEDCSSSGKTSGLFAREVMGKFPEVVVEDEKRLSNLDIRENFLSRVFCVAEFEEVGDEKDLASFHEKYKLLFRSYDKKREGELVGILSGSDSFDVKKMRYGEVLVGGFSKERVDLNCAEVIRDLFLELVRNESEKKFFESEFLKFRDSKLRLNELRILLEDLVVREDASLLKSRFFVPFPEGLIDLEDSGRVTGIHFEKERD
jgi:uncharacterized protein YbbK (DUF523 family)/uncharacterized protein YbgA (DUF1722 family)